MYLKRCSHQEDDVTSISFSDDQSEDTVTNEDDFDYEENFLEEQESLYVNV